MNFNKKITKNRLKRIPVDMQVWVYSAEIILEFLNNTIVPTRHFMTTEGKINASLEGLKKKHFDVSACVDSLGMSIDDLYELYLIFRENRDYTSELETKYKFSLIIGKLSYRKNGWKFFKKRFSRKQIIMFYPVLTRGGVNSEIRKKYPVRTSNLEGSQIDVSFKDMQTKEGEEEEEEERIWAEAIYEHREWIEAVYELPYIKEQVWVEAVKWIDEEDKLDRKWTEH